MLSLGQRLTIWGRLLLVQATWSYRRMQTPGWLWIAEPVARHRSEGTTAFLRSLVVEFNTHALLAPLLFGSAIRELLKPDADPEVAKRQLTRWMSSFGALGDMIYWQAMWWSFVWLAGGAYLLFGITGTLIVAGLWILVEVTFRIILFEIGLQRADGVVETMRYLNTPTIRARFVFAGIAMMSLIAGYIFADALRLVRPDAITWIAGTFLGIVGALIASRSRFRGMPLWLSLAAMILWGLIK